MSDARKMNRAITNYLKQTLQGSGRDSHIFALALMITGLIRGKSSHFEQIGAKSGATAKNGSRVKQIHRFIKNKHVAYESHYLPFIQVVIASLGLSEFRLSIDSSQVGRTCLMLTIGLVYKQGVIPLVWMIYKGKKGHSSADKQIELLTQVRNLLPVGAKVIITGDAEFDGTEVVSWFKAQPNWDYACRTAKNIMIRTHHQVEAQALEELAPLSGQNHFLSQVYFTQQEIGPVNIAILWNEAAAEHLYLVTSAQSLTEAQSWYRRRFKIETLFADTKSRGFGLHKSGIREPQRLARFIIAVFLAYIWMIYLGVLVIQEQRLDRVARTDRFMHSLFRLGCLYLDLILEEGQLFKRLQLELAKLDDKQMSGEPGKYQIDKAEIICGTIQEIHVEAMKMSKIEVTLGDGNTFYGNFVVAKSIENSFNKASEANVSDELKTLLTELAGAVGKMTEHLQPEEAEQVARDLETLTAEAASSEPRKRWWELSIDGLKQAANNIGEIGIPVIETATKIAALLTGLQ